MGIIKKAKPSYFNIDLTLFFATFEQIDFSIKPTSYGRKHFRNHRPF